jgi:drug/metabolite transporter (DMT)-like permease
MGYFDALAASNFKTTPDGRRLFYPWGIWGRGYLIPSDEHYERLLGRIKTYTMVSLVLVIAMVVVLKGLWAVLGAAVLMVFYAAWVPSLVRGLQPTDEKLTMSESMATQARTHSAPTLWALLVVALLFVAIGIGMLAFQPREWLIAAVIIVFFGLCAAIFVRMLLLRRRASDQAPR